MSARMSAFGSRLPWIWRRAYSPGGCLPGAERWRPSQERGLVQQIAWRQKEGNDHGDGVNFYMEVGINPASNGPPMPKLAAVRSPKG